MGRRKFFNKTGPCDPERHYMLPPKDRLVGAQLERYVEDQLFWVLHAPRQTGKTTFMLSWMRELNESKKAVACYVSVERCQGISDPQRAMPSIREAIKEYTSMLGLDTPMATTTETDSILSNMLGNWAKLVAPKPLVVLFDEVDVLVDDTMVSFLRQLRGGFASRGVGRFPISIMLVGMRDLRDYIVKAKGGIPVNPGSPFNIKFDSATIASFSKAEVVKLFKQRTDETGQQITTDALDYVYDQSRGQPWIVNALFDRATTRILDIDSTDTVTLGHVVEARKQMIEARETHLDSLWERLRNPDIRSVIETIIVGKTDLEISKSHPAVELAMDLGLLGWSLETGFVIANPIYADMFTRFLNAGYHDNLPYPTWQWQKSDGTLDMDNLMKEFLKFWRRNSEMWEQKSDYTEAFPHLLLMAFLQRVLNGGGRIEREYAAGRGRTDLAVEFKGIWYVIEIKIIYSYNSPKEVREEGLEQIRWYRDKIDTKAPAYLVIFDRRPAAKEKSWDERIQWEQVDDVTVISA